MLAAWGAPMCAWMVEAFPPEARFSAVAIGYNIAQALAGGSSMLVATVLVQTYSNMAVAWYLMVVAIISTTVLYLSKDCLVVPENPNSSYLPSNDEDSNEDSNEAFDREDIGSDSDDDSLEYEEEIGETDI